MCRYAVGLLPEAELRWRLFPSDWVLEGNTLRGEGVVMTVNTEDDAVAPVWEQPSSRAITNTGSRCLCCRRPYAILARSYRDQFLIMRSLFSPAFLDAPRLGRHSLLRDGAGPAA